MLIARTGLSLGHKVPLDELGCFFGRTEQGFLDNLNIQ